MRHVFYALCYFLPEGRNDMAILRSEKTEKDAVLMGGSMMALSARTAPKTRGLDSVKTVILTGEDLESLAVAMEKKAQEKSTDLPSFKRDAGNVRASAAVLLIGVSRDPKRMELPLNCGACGNKRAKIFWPAVSEKGRILQDPSAYSRRSIWESLWVRQSSRLGNFVLTTGSCTPWALLPGS